MVWKTSLFPLFWVAVDHFFWNHNAYLLVNEENQPFCHDYCGFGNLILLWKCLPSEPRAPRQERREKMVFMRAIFPLFFESFQDSSCAVDLNFWGVNGLGFSQLLGCLGLVDGFWAISLHVLSTVDHWVYWALDPW